MSLRLDPKYHGVRVARVRPKDSVIRMSLKRFEHWRGFMDVREDTVLYFERDLRNQWVEPVFQPAAMVSGRYYGRHIHALEALGLR